MGTIIFTTSIKFVTPRNSTTMPESMPAVVTDPASNVANVAVAVVVLPPPLLLDDDEMSVNATAAILFIG
jgi:hypothetical protein